MCSKFGVGGRFHSNAIATKDWEEEDMMVVLLFHKAIYFHSYIKQQHLLLFLCDYDAIIHSHILLIEKYV